ncbi:small conductance calcium-activated potassium channel protein 2-like isoform X2 [Symsagittifera roscoffensis]|uniref:small conductance calcium-activated potassium channel protein 2-like isoform X2 n=1 Tax=Symsagittifera roscoffensis TaxID=84072 RepID=UPI00307BEA27
MLSPFQKSEERDESFNRLSTDTYIGKRGVTLKAASMDNPSNLDSNPSEIDPVPSKTASAVGLVAGYSPGQAKRVSSEFLDPNLTPMPSPSPSYVHQDGNENRHLRNTTNPYAPLVKSKTVSCGSSLYNKNPKLKNFGVQKTGDGLHELSFKVPSQPVIAQPMFSNSIQNAGCSPSREVGKVNARFRRAPSRAASEYIPGLAASRSKMLRNDSKASYRSISPLGRVNTLKDASFTGSLENYEGMKGIRPTNSVPDFNTSMRDKQSQAHASYRLGFRRSLFEKRKQLCDLALILAALGIVLMVLDNELYTFQCRYSDDPEHSVYWSGSLIVIKLSISLTTLMLVASIIAYHAREIQLFMVDNCVDDWQIALTSDRISQITAEIVVCSIHTPPIRNMNEDYVTFQLLLSTLMFSRLYLIGRAMLLHSKLFTDASSRSIGALNRINFNTRFVIKTLMTICPGSVMMVLTVSLWFILSWIMRICEQSAAGDGEKPLLATFLDAMYLVGITFFAIGYGDYYPVTYCGRGVSITCGLMGAGCTAMVVAVLARKLELSRAEKHVHNFMMDNQLSKRLKCAAANVLRETWFIYKNTKLAKKLNHRVIRKHQRLFLSAIHTLRKTKIDQRKLFDQANQMVDLAKTQEIISQIYEQMQENNETLEARMNLIEQKLESLHTTLTQFSTYLVSVANINSSLQNQSANHNHSSYMENSDGNYLTNPNGEGGGVSIPAPSVPPLLYQPASTATRTRSLMRRPRVVSSRQGSDVSETTA